MKTSILKGSQRVLALLEYGKRYIVTKDNKDNLFTLNKRNTFNYTIYFYYLQPIEKEKNDDEEIEFDKIKVKLSDFIGSNFSLFYIFNRIVLKPLNNQKVADFNIWPGLKCQNINTFDITKIQLILDFIHKVICSSNDDCY